MEQTRSGKQRRVMIQFPEGPPPAGQAGTSVDGNLPLKSFPEGPPPGQAAYSSVA